MASPCTRSLRLNEPCSKRDTRLEMIASISISFHHTKIVIPGEPCGARRGKGTHPPRVHAAKRIISRQKTQPLRHRRDRKYIAAFFAAAHRSICVERFVDRRHLRGDI